VSKKSDFTMTDVDQIFKIIDQLNDVEIEFQSGDVKLWVKKSHTPEQSNVPVRTSEMSVTSATKPPDIPVKAAPGGDVSPPANRRPSSLPKGAVEVRSPMLGRFFSAPSPTDSPYVTLGQHVSEGDTIALLEVMKLFSTITAELSGTVIEISVKNGEMVEFGQTLFVIQPD
jgi:acetyl-CoA carboxylase biotin carboxyl carrier protein